MTETIELQNRTMRCVIAPEFGGSVVRLDVVRKGSVIPLLAPTPEEALVAGHDPRLFSLAPIAPIGGRVRKNGFKWEGKFLELQPNLADEPLFINGIVWQRPWQGKKDSKNAATLRYLHKNQAGWPFDFSVTAVFDLYEDNLEITYEIANESQRGDIPFGFGATMRIPCSPQTLLTARVDEIWAEDDARVPVKLKELPFNLDLKDGFILGAVETPHERWFSNWGGRAAVDYVENKLSLMVRAEHPLAFLGFDHQKGSDFFRLSALSHAPGMMDMVGMDEDDTGFRVLGPGESCSTKIRVDIDLNLY